MNITGQDIWLALGLLLFFEGVLYSLLPIDYTRRLFRILLDMPENNLKFSALIIATIGMFIIWFAS